MKKVTINKSDFVLSHNKQPRGYGNWMFSFIDPHYANTDPTFKMYPFIGTYSQAVKAAKQLARLNGYSTVWVLA